MTRNAPARHRGAAAQPWQTRASSAGLHLGFVQWVFGVQPAAPAERGPEVSPFRGGAGAAGIARGQGSQALLLERELQIIAFPFLQRNELWC